MAAQLTNGNDADQVLLFHQQVLKINSIFNWFAYYLVCLFEHICAPLMDHFISFHFCVIKSGTLGLNFVDWLLTLLICRFWWKKKVLQGH